MLCCSYVCTLFWVPNLCKLARNQPILSLSLCSKYLDKPNRCDQSEASDTGRAYEKGTHTNQI